MHMGGGLAKLVVRAEVPSALGQGVSPLRAAPLGAVVVLVDDALVLLDVPPERSGRGLDMRLPAGERISMSLLCMAIADHGVAAASFTGSQAGIVTDTTHGKARILEVKGDRLRDALAAGQVTVVAGFQ